MNNQIIEEDAERVIAKIDIKKLKGKSILLTGATGLIGTYYLYCIKTLNEKYDMQIELSIVIHNGLPDHLIEFNDLAFIRKYQGDLSDSLFCESLPHADYIVHAAGYGQPGKFLDKKEKTILINTLATECLLRKVKPNGTLLYISSSEVYSGSSHIPYTEECYGTTMPSHDRACYIEGKRCGEALCHVYAEKGVGVKIARVALAYGPGFAKDDKRALNNFIQKGAHLGKIELIDGGDARRTYCYITDTLELLWCIMLKGKDLVYNVGGNSHTSILGLASLIGEILHVNVSASQKNSTMEGAPEDVFLCMNKTNEEFRKQSYITLEEGLERTIQWYKANLGDS